MDRRFFRPSKSWFSPSQAAIFLSSPTLFLLFISFLLTQHLNLELRLDSSSRILYFPLNIPNDLLGLSLYLLRTIFRKLDSVIGHILCVFLDLLDLLGGE